MKHYILSLIIFTATVPLAVKAESPSKLKPVMAIKNEVVLQDDFSKVKPLKKGVWQSRQGTRWAIEGGVLKGQQSSPEYQAKKKDHFGYEARLSIPVTPQEFVASFSFYQELPHAAELFLKFVSSSIPIMILTLKY